MSQRWIKMRPELLHDPEVLMMCAELDASPEWVCGCLLRLWGMADAHGNEENNGRMVGNKAMIDKSIGRDGFADSMVLVGWLLFDDKEMWFPNYAEHNGTTAKTRATDAKRKEESRNSPAPNKTEPGQNSDRTRTELGQNKDKIRTKLGPEEIRLEEIRGDKIRLEETRLIQEGEGKQTAPAGLRELIESWNAITGLTPCRRATAKRIKAYATRSKDPEWASEMAEAIERLPRCKFLIGDNDRNWTADIDFFLRPDTVTKIIEGKYDHGTQAKQPANSSGTGHVNKRAALWEEMSRAAEARSAETPSPESIENTKAI